MPLQPQRETRTMSELVSLVRFRCGDLQPTGAASASSPASLFYDAAHVEREIRAAARQAVDRLSREHLWRLGKGATLVLEAGYNSAAEDDTSTAVVRGVAAEAEDPLAGYVVIGLPLELRRLLSLRLGGWRMPVTALLPETEGPLRSAHRRADAPRVGDDLALQALYLNEAGETVHARRETTDAPAAYEGLAGFTVTDEAGASPHPRRVAICSPPPSGYDDGSLTAAEIVAELTYVPDPDPARLPEDVQDAVCWEATSRLLGQDPETASLAGNASARAQTALSGLRPTVRRSTRRPYHGF